MCKSKKLFNIVIERNMNFSLSFLTKVSYTSGIKNVSKAIK